MKLPRNLGATELIKAQSRIGNVVARQRTDWNATP